MTCQPEMVTGYVDGALDADLREEIEAHLSGCPACQTQADDERALRAALLALPRPALPDAAFERVRQRLLPRRRPSAARILIPFAAVAAVLVVSIRSAPRFAAWEMSRDHDHCFGGETLPAEIASEEPEAVMRWFEERGTRIPVLPSNVRGHELVGARYCWMPDLTHAAHVYYRAESGPLSLFVFSRTVGPREPLRLIARGHTVQVARLGELTIGIVSDHAEDLDAFARALSSSRADVTEPYELPRRQVAAGN